MLPSVSVVRWLRVEGLAALALSIVLYFQGDHGWLLFVGLLFVPDLSMLGYLNSAQLVARLYNLVHTYTAPLMFAALGVLTGDSLVISLALIWTSHIGLDRMLGYGLKLPTSFRDTHLGTIGRETAAAPA
jgi:hypothetical protein